MLYTSNFVQFIKYKYEYYFLIQQTFYKKIFYEL